MKNRDYTVNGDPPAKLYPFCVSIWRIITDMLEQMGFIARVIEN